MNCWRCSIYEWLRRQTCSGPEPDFLPVSILHTAHRSLAVTERVVIQHLANIQITVGSDLLISMFEGFIVGIELGPSNFMGCRWMWLRASSSTPKLTSIGVGSAAFSVFCIIVLASSNAMQTMLVKGAQLWTAWLLSRPTLASDKSEHFQMQSVCLLPLECMHCR